MIYTGVGLLQVLLSTIVMWYNIFVLGWTIYFFYNAFFPKSPWATCGNWWNTPHCKGIRATIQAETKHKKLLHTKHRAKPQVLPWWITVITSASDRM